MIIICMFLMLTPPSIQEIRYIDRENNHRVQYVVPDGYNNHIRVDVPEGMEADGRREAEAFLKIIHPDHEYRIMTSGVAVEIRAHNQTGAMGEIKRWFRLIGQSE